MSMSIEEWMTMSIEEWMTMYNISVMPRPDTIDIPRRTYKTGRDGQHDFSCLELGGRSYSSRVRDCVDNLYPDDKSEQELQEKQNQLWWCAKDEAHSLSAINDGSRVLDIGCGSGHWVKKLATMRPHLKIEGFDISMALPYNEAYAVHFYHYDCNTPLPEGFDFIHVRDMMLSIRNFSGFASECFRSLKPGGRVEISEALLIPDIRNVDTEELPAFAKWKRMVIRNASVLGIDLQSVNPKDLRQKLEAVGFAIEIECVRKSSFVLQDEIGAHFEAGFRRISLLLLSLDGSSFAQAQLDIANAIKELKQNEVEVEWPFITICAWKANRI